MAPAQGQQPQKGLPNPYPQGVLPNPYALKATVEAPPVIYSEQPKSEPKPTALMFKPHHLSRPRPQPKGNFVVKKPTRPMKPAATPVEAITASKTQHEQPGLDYWKSTEDDDAEVNYAREQRRKEEIQRKKEEKAFTKKYGDWKPTAQHQPSKWTNIMHYKANGGHETKINAFREFLREAGRRSGDSDGDIAANGPRPNSQSILHSPTDAGPMEQVETGDEAYARRVRLSATPQPPLEPPPPPPPLATLPPPPPPPPQTAPYSHTIAAPPVKYSHTISAPPVSYSHTVSSAPVHYPQPEVRDDVQDERPAKKIKPSYGERMLAKMGHVEGQGLGKNSDGITTHLEAVKRKGQNKINDNGDRERVKSAQVFDIRGGQRNTQPEESKFGKPSSVIVAWGLCDGVDLAADRQRDDGGIRQEMGDVFNPKFGNIERIHYNADISSPPVYIKFNDGLSALNAVNRFDEGYEFQNRKVKAHFYAAEKFDALIFDF